MRSTWVPIDFRDGLVRHSAPCAHASTAASTVGTNGPPSYATSGSAVPWNATTDIGLPWGHGAPTLTPATGAIAAIWRLSLHPRYPDIPVPLENPVAYTRRRSMHSSAAAVSMSAPTKAMLASLASKGRTP